MRTLIAFFLFSHYVSSTFIPHIRHRIGCFPFVLFFHASYPIFPILRVLCSERFFFSRFWADQIGNQKLLSPVKSLFVNACPILFACWRKKKRSSAHRIISFPLYPYIPFFPQTTFPRRSGVLRKEFPQIFFPLQAYVGFWVFNRSPTALRFLDLRPAFRVRVCAFSRLDERAAGPFCVTPFLVMTGTNKIVRCYGCFF